MPKTSLTIPPLQIPHGNASEAETTSTSSTATDLSDRSPGNRLPVPSKRKLSMGSQNKNKTRKPSGMRLLKKTPLKVNSQQKTTAALQLKSHIPRAVLLTPSSSSASLSTNESLPSPLVPVNKTPSPEKPLTAREKELTSTLQRQKTGIILAFRQRKSISQMDFIQARRHPQFSVTASPKRPTVNDNNENNKSLMPWTYGDKMMVSNTHNSFVHKMYKQDNYYFAMHDRDPHMAGMRIFAIIMLNAWRKRRDEVKHLLEEVNDLKRGAVKAKNQLHVFNTLFRVEQKRNDELNCQLKRSLEDISATKSSCESLTTSLISVKADKALLEQQLQIKEHEVDDLNTLLSQTQSDLFKSMSLQRELQADLSMEQRKVQTLENQKNELITEICELSNENMLKEETLRNEIQLKIHEYRKVKNELQDMEEKIKLLNESKEQQCRESNAREERMRQEIEMLENDLKILHKCLEATFGNRLKNCWNNTMTYQKVTWQMLHWLAFYILPATPPPSKINTLPFGLSLNKALSIVKR